MDRRIWAMSHHERAGDINNVYVYRLTGRGRSPPPLLAPNIYTYFYSPQPEISESLTTVAIVAAVGELSNRLSCYISIYASEGRSVHCQVPGGGGTFVHDHHSNTG